MRVFLPLTLATAVLSLTPTSPEAQEYFGEDLFGFPSSGATVSRSLTFPNASGAEALFLAALTSDVGTEDFEGFSHNTASPITLTFPGAGTASLSGNGRVRDYEFTGEWRGNDRYPTSGDMFYDTDGGGDFAIQFGSPVAAFGFYGVDIGDVGGQLFLDFISGTGTTTITVPHTVGRSQNTTGGVIYYGRISTADPFTEVRFRNNGGSDLFAFDNMTIGSERQVLPPSVVPEPTGLVLLGTGLAGLWMVAARRRKREREE